MSRLDFTVNESAVAPTMGAGALDISYKKKMYRSVVFIRTNSGTAGTGSIVWFQSQPMLLTCHHVIPTAEVAEQCTVYFHRQNNANPGTAVSGERLFDLSGFISSPPEDLDFCLIPLNKIPDILDDLKEEDFLALDGCLHLESHALKPDDQVYLVHYPKIDREFAWRESPYRVLFLHGYLIGHGAETDCGSSGCPVLKEVDRKWVLVGMHTGSMMKKLKLMGKEQEVNIATKVEEIHKFCTTPVGYTLPAIDKQKMMEALQKVPAPTPDPLLPMPQAVNLTPGNVLTEQDPPTKPVTPPPDQPPLSEPPSGSTQPGPEDAQWILDKYKARLLSEGMNAKAVSTRLKNNGVIPAKLFSQLSKQDTIEEANDLLFAHLRGQATLVSLQSFSRVLVEVGREGYARMKVLGEELLAELDQLLPAPSSSLPS